jgi:16S rRNA (cytidine1402-2'-O)-methyltransferase
MFPGLYIVACPIGNADDITVRALDALKTADLIAAEDTRQTRRLLAHHGISAGNRLISCHEHNERQRVEQLLTQIDQGKSVALVTDAGTPSISDPGFPVVKAAIARGVKVVPVPGVSAATTALSVSGLPTDAFVFAGFLPKKGNKRRDRLTTLAEEAATLIFYESPRRIAKLINELTIAMGDRQAVVCREMTKPYEEFLRGRLSEIAAGLRQKDAVKGEITVIVAGASSEGPELSLSDLQKAIQESKLSPSALARQLSEKYGRPKRQIYEDILTLTKKVAD